mmetsp:Transcript_67152/g.116890  ORF Transcript_67152/g.116890 Transcript_67152/m.116890 type:complete len:221 (-) Transcript_67152:885-1547(-)
MPPRHRGPLECGIGVCEPHFPGASNTCNQSVPSLFQVEWIFGVNFLCFLDARFQLGKSCIFCLLFCQSILGAHQDVIIQPKPDTACFLESSSQFCHIYFTLLNHHRKLLSCFFFCNFFAQYLLRFLQVRALCETCFGRSFQSCSHQVDVPRCSGGLNFLLSSLSSFLCSKSCRSCFYLGQNASCFGDCWVGIRQSYSAGVGNCRFERMSFPSCIGHLQFF